MVFYEKSTINLIGVVLYMMSCFSLDAFKILSLAFKLDYKVSRNGTLLTLSYLQLTELLDV